MANALKGADFEHKRESGSSGDACQLDAIGVLAEEDATQQIVPTRPSPSDDLLRSRTTWRRNCKVILRLRRGTSTPSQGAVAMTSTAGSRRQYSPALPGMQAYN